MLLDAEERSNFIVLLVIGFVCVTLFQDVETASAPTVTIPLGKIEGYLTETVNGREYIAFEGIPYAEPPVGERRFAQPQPVQQWKGVWQAKTPSKCIQYNHFSPPGDDRVIGEEDCLHVNVYIPRIDPEARLNVIFFVHGGAFMFNNGTTYGSKIIMDKDIIYVTLNYRLGPLGFLSTEDEVVPGNNGIRDQILALKWVKDNIAYFGGNPESITVTGMSAGGASVQLYYISPLTKGLFNRGFSQSGTILNPWVLNEKPLEKAKKLGSILGCSTKDSKTLVKCLRCRPARQVVNAVKEFLPWLYNPFSPFGVVVDKWSPNPVLPEHPYLLLKNKKVYDLPWLASNVQAEGLYPGAEYVADPKYLEEMNAKWDEVLPHILDFNYTVDASERAKVIQEIRKEYLKDKPVNKETFLRVIDMVSDRLFTYDMLTAVRLQAAAMSSPVYYYYFSYRGAHSKSEVLSKSQENYGTCHGDDTVYVLSSTINMLSTPEDRNMSTLFLDLWTTYADSGIPELPNNKKWPRVSRSLSDPVEYLHIKSPTELEIETTTELGNQKFWSSLPLKENEKLLAEIKDEL